MSRAIIGTLVRLVGGFLRWYWKQSATGMVIAALLVLLAANYLGKLLGLPESVRGEATTTLGIGLLLLAAAAYFGRAFGGKPRKR